MIPLKLQIKNFLSYGAELQTINFGPYPLICLSGKNGHGKSALLDAITWAVWGQARKVAGNAKADNGLLRLGQTQMMVVLDFELGGTVYRVRREFAQTYGKPYANLEFGMLDAESDKLIPLTDKTIRATQEKIEKTLRLDFESFINSAFLRQGSSNEFSKKSAKDRKEILATILGLNQFDVIRKKALEKTKTALTQQQTFATLKEKLITDIEKKSELNNTQKNLENSFKDLIKQHNSLEKNKLQLDEEQKQLTDQQKKHELLAYQVSKLTEQEEQQKTILKECVAQWRTIHKKQLNQKDTTQLEAEKKLLVAQIAQHQETLQRQLEHKESYLKIKEELQGITQKHREQQVAAIHKQKAVLDQIKVEVQNNTNQQESDLKAHSQYKNEIAQLTAEIEKLTAYIKPKAQKEAELARIEKQFEKRKEYYQNYIAQGNIATSELKNIDQKNKLVEDTDNPSCPLCEQNLSSSRRRFLQQQLHKNEQLITHKRNRLAKVIKKLKVLLIEQHEQLSDIKKTIAEYTGIEIKITEYIKNKERAQKTFKEIEDRIDITTKRNESLKIKTDLEQKKLDAIEKESHDSLNKQHDYIDAHTRLKTIEATIKATQYSADLHQKTQQKLSAIEEELNTSTNLQEQIAQQKQRTEIISKQCSDLKELKKQKIELHEQLKTFSKLPEQEELLKSKNQAHQKEVRDLQDKKEILLQEKAQLQANLNKLNQSEKELREQEKTINALQATIHDYQAIAAATGKDGIQALLIEDAIPEIEQEANHLLAKLTNNQSHIMIESLRDLKKGGTKETLDIKISDSAGIRPYELFSGGEAFRIDFAIRIAISKLLARRAGTALQTLIIDEGFGSQDEDGLAHIMEAIYAIQEDFSKVIVVSHLNTMKNQFPVHFVVNKGPNGSQVSILEQG
jgi:exonuclease SbcC